MFLWRRRQLHERKQCCVYIGKYPRFISAFSTKMEMSIWKFGQARSDSAFNQCDYIYDAYKPNNTEILAQNKQSNYLQIEF
jgi:hypothetical protein